jgi:MFS superfamily sulfate permease-like transporter
VTPAGAAATGGHQGRAGFFIPGWLREYRTDWLRPDGIAGLTAAAVVIRTAIN